MQHSKIFIVLPVIMLVSIILIQCDQPEAPQYPIGEYIAIQGSKNVPDWIKRKNGIIDHLGEKYVWFKGKGISKQSAMSKTLAKKDSITNSAKAIALISQKYRQQNLVTNNIKTGLKGYLTIRTYKKQTAVVTKLMSDNSPDLSQLTKLRWEYEVMMGCPYRIFIDLLVYNVGIPWNSSDSPDVKKLMDLVDKELAS